MGKTYVVKEQNDNGCLWGLIIAAVIIGLIIAILVVAAYIIGILLLIILGCAVLIGGVFALKNFFVALGQNIGYASGYSKPAGWFIPDFFYKWVKVFWETIKETWVQNIDSGKDFFNKAGFHRVLSFQKWFNLFIGLSIFVFGMLITVALVILQVQILLAVFAVILALIVAVGVVFTLIGLVFVLPFVCMNYFGQARDARDSAGSYFGDYARKDGFLGLWGLTCGYFGNIRDKASDLLADAAMYSFISFRKWLNFWCTGLHWLLGSLFFPVFLLLHLVVLSVLSIVFWIVALFQKIFRR